MKSPAGKSAPAYCKTTHSGLIVSPASRARSEASTMARSSTRAESGLWRLCSISSFIARRREAGTLVPSGDSQMRITSSSVRRS